MSTKVGKTGLGGGNRKDCKPVEIPEESAKLSNDCGESVGLGLLSMRDDRMDCANGLSNPEGERSNTTSCYILGASMSIFNF